MIVPTFAECVRIVETGEEIGRGADRIAFTHPDFPGIVVKKGVWSSDYLSLSGQNKSEVQNYKWLMARGLPDNIRVPETVAVGGFVVQEFVTGTKVRGHRYAGYGESGAPIWACRCLEEVGFCWEAVIEEITSDGHDENVVVVGTTVWLFDLGYIRADA